MKKLFVISLSLCVIAALAFSAFGAEKKPLDQMTIGYVMPYNIGWFAYFGDAFDLIAKSNGIKTVRMLSDWQPDKEAKAVQDLISMGVDAINVCSGSPDSAQYVAQLANEAGIPLSIEDSAIAPGPGKPIADIEFDWYRAGEMLAEEISTRWPGSKIVFIQGIAGVGPVELQNQGIKAKAEELGNIEVVAIQYGDYMIEKAFNITKDLVQSGLEFDVAIGGCQELSEGIIEGLKSEGVEGKIVLTVNGGPMDIVNFDEGELHGGVSQSPGFHALLCALTVIEYLKGNPVPELVHTPLVWITPEDYKEKHLPWEMDESWIPVAEKFIRTGVLEY